MFIEDLHCFCSNLTFLSLKSPHTAAVTEPNRDDLSFKLAFAYPSLTGAPTQIDSAQELLPAPAHRIHADVGRYRLRLAESAHDREAACRLRFGVFNYDLWCLFQLKRALIWIEEWFSICQKRVEQALIVIYFLTVIPGPFRKSYHLQGTLLAGLCVLLGAIFWQWHRKPAALRMAMVAIPQLCIGRVLIIQLFLVGFDIAIHLTAKITVFDILEMVRQTTYALIVYVTTISTHGEPGRRRKLALEELKKMFGTDWIPRPVRVLQG